MSTALTSSQGASRASGQSSSLFMSVPPTSSYGAISDGYIRPSSVEPVTSALRNRYRPIYQPGQSRHVGGPQNSGDSQAKMEGGGSFATSKGT